MRFLSGRLDQRQQLLCDGVLGERTHVAVGDLAVARNHIGLRHAIDAPVDGDAPRAVGADPGERVAVAAEEPPRRRRIVLVIDAVKANPGLFGKIELAATIN